MFHGTKVTRERKFSLWSFRSRERKCRGTKRPVTSGIQAFSFLCTFVPWSEKSPEGTFAPVELLFCGTFAHRNFRSCGTFVPRERTFQELSFHGTLSVEHSLNFRSSVANVPRTFVPMKLSFHDNEYSKNFRFKCPKTRPETGYLYIIIGRDLT